MFRMSGGRVPGPGSRAAESAAPCGAEVGGGSEGVSWSADVKEVR